MQQSVISLDAVSWMKQGQTILDDISWRVNPGEHWAILGLNGSGKTSILNIVAGYAFPTVGKVKVLDTVFGEANILKMRERIGYMSSALEKFGSTFNNQLVKNIVLSGRFASFALFKHHEVAQRDLTKLDQMLANFRLDHLKEKPYRQLSQGEKRRVLIARALMNEPELLILDEPCSSLDVLAREELLAVMAEITATGCQLLYVTHHVEEIIDTITHVLLLKDGEVLAQGRKEAILTDALLGETYNLPVSVRWENQRPWMTISN